MNKVNLYTCIYNKCKKFYLDKFENLMLYHKTKTE